MISVLQQELGLVLRVTRLKARLDQQQLAGQLGVSQSKISRIESGAVLPKYDLARGWLDACKPGMPPRERLALNALRQALEEHLGDGADAGCEDDGGTGSGGNVGAGQLRRVVKSTEASLLSGQALGLMRIPYFADVAAGLGEAQEVRSEPRAQIEVPSTLVLEDPGCYAMRVSGDSMAPQLLDGDIVVVSPAADLHDGCIVAAYVEPDGDVVKAYHRLPGGTVVLQPANPAYPPVVVEEGGGREVKIWGRVVFQQREL